MPTFKELETKIMQHDQVRIGNFYYNSEMVMAVFAELRMKAWVVSAGFDAPKKSDSLLVEILMAELGEGDDA